MSVHMEDRRNSFLQDVAAHATQLFQDYGIAQDVAEQAGSALADHLANHWGGQVISFPQDMAYQLALRDQKIIREFRGNNLAAIARKYHLAERSVRRILRRADLLHQAADQGQLFNR